jgi:hypothetical protein
VRLAFAPAETVLLLFLVMPSDAATGPVAPPPPAAIKELDPEKRAALDAVLRLKEISTQLGGSEQLITVFGGPQAFDALFASTVGKTRFTAGTVKEYLRRDFTNPRNVIGPRQHLPGDVNVKRINTVIALVEPFLPDADLACTAQRLAAISNQVQQVVAHELVLAGIPGTRTESSMGRA